MDLSLGDLAQTKPQRGSRRYDLTSFFADRVQDGLEPQKSRVQDIPQARKTT